jgi:hypothetical protein
VVEGGCEESARVCKKSVVGNSGGKEVASVAGSGGAEGDETQDSISVGSAEGAVVSARENPLPGGVPTHGYKRGELMNQPKIVVAGAS